MSRLRQTITHDLSRGFLIFFVSLLIVIPAAFLIGVLLYENQTGTVSDAFLIIGGIVWMIVFLGGMILMITTTTRRRKKWLDGVFNPLGLVGHRYLINWWEYTGMFNGRQVTARFYKGPTLDLIMSTSLMTRFVLSSPNELSDLLAEQALRKGPEPSLRLSNPALAGVIANALDKNWFIRLTEIPKVVDLFVRLLSAGESWALIKQIILSPGQIKLTLYRNKNLINYDFTVEEVKTWFEDLTNLLDIVENGEAPQQIDTETKLEKDARSGKLTRRAILILLAFFIVIGACFGVALWFLVRYGG